MTHKYNTRAKKDSVVTNESLENLEDNIIKNINSVKDKIINLKEKFIKLFQENNEKLCDKLTNVEDLKTNQILLKLLLIP